MTIEHTVAEQVLSPCVGECCLNEQDVCMGCWRSLTEIKQWSVVNDEIRRTFLSNAKIRQKNQAFV